MLFRSEALIHGLNVAKDIGIRRIACFGDSDLVVQQSSGNWDALDANMGLYRFHVQKISGFFDGCEYKHISWLENEAADILSKLGSSRDAIPPGISLNHLRIPSIKPSPDSESIFIPKQESEAVPMNVDVGYIGEDPGTAWRDPGTANRILGKRSRVEGDANRILGNGQKLIEEIMAAEPVELDEHLFPLHPVPEWAEEIMKFMSEGSLTNDETEARRVQGRSKGYTIINK